MLEEAQAYTLDLTNWHEFLKVLVRAGFRGEGMITSKNALLYAYVLYLVGKRDFKVKPDPLREVIARWFFMVSLTGRYTSSPESRIESDLAQLRGMTEPEEFTAVLDQVIENTLTADFWQITLPNALATSAARSPSLYGYYAALNLLDARVLFSKMRVRELFDPALKAKRSPVERHHLFPRKYLKSIEIEGFKEVNQIANFALVEWPDNAAISGAAPVEYAPMYVKQQSEPEMEQMSFWHALPSGWEEMSYRDFLAARRRMLAEVIKAGYVRLRTGEGESGEKRDAATLIAGGETGTVEFKSTARYNAHTNQADPRLEMVVVKTVAGFANAAGGTLLIGVSDEGEILGLESDFALTRKGGADGFQLWLTDLLAATVGKPAASGASVGIEQVEGQQVCRVDVRPAVSPVFVSPPRGDGEVEFYVRMNNSTRQLNAAEMHVYQKDRWTGG